MWSSSWPLHCAAGPCRRRTAPPLLLCFRLTRPAAAQANPNEKQVKHAMKVSDLTGEQVEITGAAKRLLAEQAEKEQEMVAVQNGTNEEGAANLERLAEVRQRRAEAAAKRAEETVRPQTPTQPTFPPGVMLPQLG